MSWIASNRAHACLWLVETWHHNRRDVGFDEVGSWKSDFIVKSAAGESAQQRADKVETHAALLDEMFTSLYRATYEPAKNKNAALSEMQTVLGDPANTMTELADIVDGCYLFRGEV